MPDEITSHIIPMEFIHARVQVKESDYEQAAAALASLKPEAAD